MGLERKTFEAAFKVLDGDQGIVEAFVAVFNNVDSGGDRILPGFFADSLKMRSPKGVWMHQWEMPVAKTLVAEEIQKGDIRLPPSLKQFGGLYVKSQFNLETQRGREAFSDIKFGIIDEYSIGFSVEKYEMVEDARNLVKGTLYEWSPVLVGMNEMTTTISAKADPNVQTKEGPKVEEKMSLGGSYEEDQEKLSNAFYDACVEMMSQGGESMSMWDYYTFVFGTYPDHLVGGVFFWESGETRLYQADWSRDDAGNVTLGPLSEVELTVAAKGLFDGLLHVKMKNSLEILKVAASQAKSAVHIQTKAGARISNATRTRLTSIQETAQGVIDEISSLLSEGEGETTSETIGETTDSTDGEKSLPAVDVSDQYLLFIKNHQDFKIKTLF